MRGEHTNKQGIMRSPILTNMLQPMDLRQCSIVRARNQSNLITVSAHGNLYPPRTRVVCTTAGRLRLSFTMADTPTLAERGAHRICCPCCDSSTLGGFTRGARNCKHFCSRTETHAVHARHRHARGGLSFVAHPPARKHHDQLRRQRAVRGLLSAAARRAASPTMSVECELFGLLPFFVCICTRVGKSLTAALVAPPGPQSSSPHFLSSSNVATKETKKNMAVVLCMRAVSPNILRHDVRQELVEELASAPCGPRQTHSPRRS